MCALQPHWRSWFFLLYQCFARNVLPGCDGQSGPISTIRDALLHGDCDDPLSGTKSVSRPNGRVAEVTQLVARDHDPPVSARAPSLSLPTEKSLAVRSRGGSDMRLSGRSAVMSKPPGGERKAGWLLDDERKSSLRFALRGEADYNLRIGAAPPATRASLPTGAALSMSKSGMPSEQAEGGHSDAPPRAA